MSYDFHLFRRVAGEDPLTTARAEREDEDLRSPDPDAERIKKTVADALLAQHPRLSKFDYEAIARLHHISADEAWRRYRHIELNGPEHGHGIQITLFDHRASIRLPYWHADPAIAKAAMAEVWGYLQTLCREGSFLAYDPQLDRVLVLSHGYVDAISSYLRTVHRLRSLPL
jgi:hypothetical protein